MIFVGRGRRPLVESEELRSEFEKLVDAWALETMMSSSLHEICSHWAYQRVIGLGSPVVPLILQDVLMGRRHWGWALAAITGENPAKGTDSPKAAAEAWLKWGRERGRCRPSTLSVPETRRGGRHAVWSVARAR